MSQLFKDIKVSLDETLEEKLQLLAPGFGSYHLLKKSVDARKRHAPHEVYTVKVFAADEEIPQENYEVSKSDYSGSKPIIIGAGPAGLFCALRLVERGVPCTLLERGRPTAQRVHDINRFWRYGELNSESNVCFGEGGAGFFSDGKLITRIKSPHIPYVLHRLIKFGAPKEIQYLANPHVGSDKIRRIMPKIRKYLIQTGCEFLFEERMEELLVENSKIIGVRTQNKTYTSDKVVLATGHSSSKIFDHLKSLGVQLEGKSFAMGLRVEHPQEFIDKIQYGKFHDHPKLKSANYKITHHDKGTGVGVFSFCMCPGGYVLSSGTEVDGVVSNGMSNYNRNGKFANAAIVVTVDHKQIFGEDLFGGLNLRRELELKSFEAVQKAGGTKEIPVQKITDFLNNKTGKALPSSSPSGVAAVNWNDILPEFLLIPLKEAMSVFNSKMKGFISEQAQLHGIESRTSCPIRIPRDPESLQSTSHAGLYPAGEGAGYAGGITSAAVDGVRIADAIAGD